MHMLKVIQSPTLTPWALCLQGQTQNALDVENVSVLLRNVPPDYLQYRHIVAP